VDPLPFQNAPDWPLLFIAIGMALASRLRRLITAIDARVTTFSLRQRLAEMNDDTRVSTFRYRRRG
jgi:formate-dependent nitrite reductase membrane component NrfD